MASKVRLGDTVSWKTPQGEARGTVVKTITRPTKIKGFVAKASKADPEFVVASAKTGAKAAHKPSSLKKA